MLHLSAVVAKATKRWADRGGSIAYQQKRRRLGRKVARECVSRLADYSTVLRCRQSNTNGPASCLFKRTLTLIRGVVNIAMSLKSTCSRPARHFKIAAGQLANKGMPPVHAVARAGAFEGVEIEMIDLWPSVQLSEDKLAVAEPDAVVFVEDHRPSVNCRVDRMSTGRFQNRRDRDRDACGRV